MFLHKILGGQMKLFLGLLVLSGSLFASQLKITSFTRLTQDVRDNVSEVCVKLENHTSDSAVLKFIADPGKRQGVTFQTAYADSDGAIKACQVLAIYGSRVEVQIHGSEIKDSRNI